MPQITQQERDNLIRLQGIFHPDATRQRVERHKNGEQVVHYTSAETAMKIITSQTMWLRNTNCMSDYMEVELGFGFLQRFFRDPDRRHRFETVLDCCYPGLGAKSIAHVEGWMREIRMNTYICSVSEHDKKNEDVLGRLSMWRAFGQAATARAAIVMNMPDPWVAEGLHVTLAPVAYVADYPEVEARLEQVIKDVSANVPFLKSFSCDHLQAMAFGLLTSIAVCTKHVGYREELEWRVIYLPNYWPSNAIKPSTQTVGGIPQIVYEIPLKEDPANDVTGIGIPALVDRIIIGPSAYPVPMWTAFVDALERLGVPDPEKRVFCSNIPIRW